MKPSFGDALPHPRDFGMSGKGRTGPLRTPIDSARFPPISLRSASVFPMVRQPPRLWLMVLDNPVPAVWPRRARSGSRRSRTQPVFRCRLGLGTRAPRRGRLTASDAADFGLSIPDRVTAAHGLLERGGKRKDVLEDQVTVLLPKKLLIGLVDAKLAVVHGEHVTEQPQPRVPVASSRSRWPAGRR